MTKILRPLKIAIDLSAILDKTIDNTSTDLLNYRAYKGSLGAITVLEEVFDIYLLIPENNITDEEILRFLKAAEIDRCFRKFIRYNENVKNIILEETIHVTITSRFSIAETAKEISRVYLINRIQTADIQTQIQKVSQWREIVKDLIIFSTN